MRLLLVFDHRFERGPDGIIRSPKSYDHAFFAGRYLRVFDAVTVLARVADRADGGRDGAPTEGPGVAVHSLGDWHGPLGFARRWHRIRRELACQLASADAVIVVAPGMLAAPARRALVGARRPYGVEVVGDPYDALAPRSMRHPLRPLLRWAATRQLRRLCATATAASYVTRKALQRRYPCPGFSAGVSDVVLPAAAFVARPRVFEPSARRTLITVGTMAQLYKAQDVLLDALGICVRGGLDLGLVLVGEGQHRAELARRADARGLGERVAFTGALAAGEPIRRALDDADLFVLPSRQEGLPRAMVEAMARGLPCIGSTVGGIPELLPGDDLVPSGDARALAAKIHEVAVDDARLGRMSARNLAVAREYREDLLADTRRGFYEHLRGAVGAPPRAPGPSLRRNVSWAAVGNLGYAACQCAVLVVLAKLSSAENVGRFALALAVTAPVMIAASLQLRVVQATDARGGYPFSAYLGVRLASTALALAAIAVASLLAGYSRPTIVLILLVATAKAFESVSDVVFGLLQQHEDLRRVAVSMLAKGVLSVASIAAVLRATGDLHLAALAMALAWGACLVFYDLPAARRLTVVRPLLEPRMLARLAVLALPMGVVAGLQSLMTNVPRYAIEAHGGTRALGYFAGIAYLVVAGNQPMMALSAAVSPRLAHLFVGDRRAYRRLCVRTMLLAAAMGVATVGGAAIVGGPLLARLYAPDYAAHADLLVWLAVVAAVGYQSSALCSAITAARRFPEQLYVAALTVAVSWLASQILVPRYGIVGAAWALLAATGVQTACLALVYRRVSAEREASRSAEAPAFALGSQREVAA